MSRYSVVFTTLLKTIRMKILLSFLFVCAILLLISGMVSYAFNGMINRYNQLVNNVLNIYQISDLTNDFVESYSAAIRNIGVEAQEAKYRESSQSLRQAVDNLTVSDTSENRVAAQGVKNIVANLLSRADEGYTAAKEANLALSFSIFDELAKNQVYIKQDVNQLVLLELEQTIPIQANLERDRNIILLGSFVTAATLAIVSFVFASIYSRMISDPLIYLSSIVKASSVTEYSTAIDGELMERSDEVGILARTFEEIRQKVRSAMDSLEESKKMLETKNQSLEKLNKAMVGREMKMVELKKELEKLKSNSNV